MLLQGPSSTPRASSVLKPEHLYYRPGHSPGLSSVHLKTHSRLRSCFDVRSSTSSLRFSSLRNWFSSRLARKWLVSNWLRSRSNSSTVSATATLVLADVIFWRVSISTPRRWTVSSALVLLSNCTFNCVGVWARGHPYVVLGMGKREAGSTCKPQHVQILTLIIYVHGVHM